MTAYHAKYLAHKLTKRCSSDSGGKLAASLADAQVDLNPRQIDATPAVQWRWLGLAVTRLTHTSKETLGQVHVGGFLRNHICINPDGTNTAPSKLSNAERKLRITECWRKHLARFPTTAKCPVIAHRLVFSMSKGQHDALAGSGINADQVLHSCTH